MIVVESHRKNIETIQRLYPGAIIHDVTSHAKDEFVRFSPFYPIRGVPVPFTEDMTSACVEAVWQGLKVFEHVGCDLSLFKNTTMKDLKRTQRKFGKVKGHRKGVRGEELLDYITARKLIYLPTYKWVLENKLQNLVDKIREESVEKTVVLLDYETNSDVEDKTKPLSHASLIKSFIEGNYPDYLPDKQPQFELKESDPDYHFEKGQTVIHDVFGKGVIQEINGDRVQVQFDDCVKILSLRFAKLRTE